MACVTDGYGYAVPRGGDRRSFRWGGLLRLTAFAATGLVAGGWMIAALGTLDRAVPAFAPAASAMRHVPSAAPQALAVVDQSRLPGRRIRQNFIASYTADAAYSNLDWRRNERAEDAPVIADIGPDAVIEDKPVEMAALIEPRAERVKDRASVVIAAVVPAKAATDNMQTGSVAKAASAPTLAAYAAAPSVPAAVAALNDLQPLAKAEEADAGLDGDANLPTGGAVPVPQAALDDVPLPGRKPVFNRPKARDKVQLAYAPESGETEKPSSGSLFSPLLGQAARSRVAIYDISAATVYLPNGERLEAHSGLGHMRDNPRYVNQKNRGPTPPHTYDLRMREALFHGVEAIRLTPADSKNRFNRDGLLAHTFMLGGSGSSNGCVVFRDYARFLRAFKRGEVTKMVVVARMPSQSSSRVASLF